MVHWFSTSARSIPARGSSLVCHPPLGYRVSLSLSTTDRSVAPRLRRLSNLLGGASILTFWAMTWCTRRDYFRPSWLRRALEVVAGFKATGTRIGIVHELVHVAVLWAYTREKPLFSLQLRTGYMFASAPRWCFPRNHYHVVGLAPLLTFTPLLLGLLRVAPKWAIPALGWAVVDNVAGSTVDLYVAWVMLRRPRTHCVHFDGTVFTVWEPAQ